MMRDDAVNSEQIDCASAMERLFEFLDGELGPELESRLRAHLEVCSHCFGQAGFERRFLAAVQAARETERCPDRLRARVLDALQREGWSGSEGP